MNLETLRQMLLWSTVINYGLLLLWFALIALPHGWMHRVWGRALRVSPERFDEINLAGMVFYKAAVIFFNLVPYLALRLVG